MAVVTQVRILVTACHCLGFLTFHSLSIQNLGRSSFESLPVLDALKAAILRHTSKIAMTMLLLSSEIKLKHKILALARRIRTIALPTELSRVGYTGNDLASCSKLELVLDDSNDRANSGLKFSSEILTR